MMARAATSTELLYFRSHGQVSKLYLAFPQPAIVFKAQINDPLIGKDMKVSILYDTPGSWDYHDILPGMTLLVGSSDEGYDLGIARIRKEADGTKIYIGEESEVRLADNKYLTVLDDYQLWARHKYEQGGTTPVDFMDYDIAYIPGSTGQHSALDPVPIMGPDRVLWFQGTLGGGNTISTILDGSASYCLGSTIEAYPDGFLWTASAGSFDDVTLDKPTWTGDAPGTVRISCTVTAANGKSFTGYRVIVVFDDTALPVNAFQLNSCTGEYETGGWNYKVTLYDSAALPQVRDRAQCILFARDWYDDITNLTSNAISFDAATKKIQKTSGLNVFTKGAIVKVSGSTSNDGEYVVITSNTAYLVVDKNLINESAGADVTIQVLHGQTEISIGPVPGCENIICTGWISKEDLYFDILGGRAEFTVYGPYFWLNQMMGFISGLRHSETDPDNWNYVLDLTVDKGLWDLLHWRCTATAMMDVFLTGSTQLVPTMESLSVGSLWEQIKEQARTTLLAVCCCDRYGRLFIEVDGQLIPAADRITSPFPLVMTVESYDRNGELEVERVTVPAIGQTDLSGVWFDGVTGYAIRAMASGHIVNRYGDVEVLDKLIMEDQAHCNELAALELAKQINPYPKSTIKIAENMRLVDICPRQQLFIVTDSDQNPRQIEVSNNAFPRRIQIAQDGKYGFISLTVESETETTSTGINVVQGEIPVTTNPPDETPPINFQPWFPILPLIPPIAPIPIPPVPTDTGPCGDDSPKTGPFVAGWDKSYLSGDPAAPAGSNIAHMWMRGIIRAASATNQTVLTFRMGNTGNSWQFIRVYGIDSGGGRVATGLVGVSPDSYDFPSGAPNYNQVIVTVTFALASATPIAGFEIELEQGYDIVPIGCEIDSATVDSTSGWTGWGSGNPCGATLTNVLDDHANGHMQYAFEVNHVAGVLWGDKAAWAINWHSPVGSDGSTLVRISTAVYSGGDSDGPHLGPSYEEGVHPVISNHIYTLSASGVAVNVPWWAEDSAPGTTWHWLGTIDMWYGGVTTTFRTLTLGTGSVVNLCPA